MSARFLFKQLDELCRGNRAAEEISLNFIAAVVAQESELGVGFHTLGDDRELQGMPQLDDGSDDGRGIGVFSHIAHEGLVDLEFVHGQPLQVREAGVARAEVIDGELHAHLFEAVQGLDCDFDILQQDGLGQFQFQHVGGQSGFLECFGHGLEQVAALELQR